MGSDVYHIPAGPDGDLSDMEERCGRVADAVGLGATSLSKLFFLVKIHFGERGNNNFVKPGWVRPLVSRLKAAGAKPFVSDTNTLYVGERSNAVDHLALAHEHGFTYDALGAPIIIADGLLGENQSSVEVNLKHYRQVSIANDARAADGLAVVTNVTGHVEAGLAGAIKNVGMGLAGRGGKRSQHCDMSPQVVIENCVACRACIQWCPTGAIEVDQYARIDQMRCIGCGECYAVCRSEAIRFEWSETSANMQEKLAEHCAGALKGKRGGAFFFSFLNAVTRNCNCIGHTEAPEIPPQGILASRDIVAVDQASADLCEKAAGEDLFRRMYPSWDHTAQLAYAERIGLGSRKYQLHEVE